MLTNTIHAHHGSLQYQSNVQQEFLDLHLHREQDAMQPPLLKQKLRVIPDLFARFQIVPVLLIGVDRYVFGQKKQDLPNHP